MPLLLDEDYEILKGASLDYEEDEAQRFLIIKKYPLFPDLYTCNNQAIDTVDVLVVIPATYNASGTDMFWVNPPLSRKDGKAIPAAFGFGQGDARIFKGKEFCRWSRHHNAASWNPKVDNIEKILGRIEWALRNPDSQK